MEDSKTTTKTTTSNTAKKVAETVVKAAKTAKKTVKSVKGAKNYESALKTYEKSKADLGKSLDGRLNHIEKKSKETVCAKVAEAKKIQEVAKETGNKQAAKKAAKIVNDYGGSCES